MALLNLAVANTMPFLRQTSFLQPFLFLGAGLGIVALVERCVPRGRARTAALLVLLVGVGVTQWAQANSVFAAQQGVGRALEWAYAQKGDHSLAWLPVGWLETTTEVQTPDEINELPADAWLLSYFPMVFIDNSPSVRASLASAGALASWPSLYATDTVRAEHRGYGFNDFRADSVLRSVQVVDVGALRAATQGRPVTVTAVTADSVASDRDEAVNVFDGDRSPDGATAWLSADTPGPHQLEFTLGEPIPLSGLDVVLPGKDQAGKDQWGSRADVLEIQVRDPGGYHVVWRGTGLARYPLVPARWTR